MYMYKYVTTNEYLLYDSIFIEVTVHEYMKIIYVNCGLKNYMKVDHCSYRCNYTCAVVKRKPKRKKFQACMGFKPLTSAFFSQLQKLRL